MKNKVVVRVVFLLMIGAFLVGSVYAEGQAERSESETYEINFPTHDALGSVQANAQQMFADLMNERSDGRVDVRVFPAGEMGGMQENTESVSVGTAEMTSTDPGFIGGDVPNFAPMSMPYMFDDWDHVARVADGAVGVRLNEVLIESQGIRILGWFFVGFRDMITISPPIRSLQDFEGVKFRSPGIPVYVEMFRALNATPTPIPWPEVYTALQNNVVDGAETTPEGMVNSRFYEACNYMTRTGHINSQSMIVINEEFYQSLPEDIQVLMDDVMAEVVEYERQAILQANEDAYEVLESNGVEIIDIDKSPLRQAVEPVWNELAGSSEAQAIIELIGEARK